MTLPTSYAVPKQYVPAPKPGTLIPTETLATWRKRSYRSAILKLMNLLELRPLIDEAEAEGQRVKMQMYAEAADAFMCHPDTVRADLATIRRYTPDKLAWLFQNGVSFAHIEAANLYAERAKKTPMQLLEEAVNLGNEHGKPMTVNELIVFATGESKHIPAFAPANLLTQLGKFPVLLQWAEEKRVKFNKWLDYGREEFFS